MGKRLMKFKPRISPKALAETHHMQYGGAWSKGRDQFVFLRGHGLEPHHKLMEFGCGAFRAGIWLLDYLDDGNYHCLEADASSLRAAIEYEIPLHGLIHKVRCLERVCAVKG